MTLSEVKELIKAGFTHDEIMGFSTDFTGNPQDPAPAAAQDPAQDPAPAAAQDPAQDPAPAAAQDPAQDPAAASEMINRLEQSIIKLIDTIQASNLANDSLDAIGSDVNRQADDIMRSIIRPEKKDKEE